LDESGFAHDRPRTHGDAQAGKRCYGCHNGGAKGRTHVIAALLGSTLIAVTLLTGTIDANGFHQGAKPCLLPALPSTSVIVLDKATFHQRNDTQQRLKDAGHTLEYLPPYSPDLNPIEKKWAQKKSIRRQTQCSIDDLFK
jgi:transposase